MYFSNLKLQEARSKLSRVKTKEYNKPKARKISCQKQRMYRSVHRAVTELVIESVTEAMAVNFLHYL